MMIKRARGKESCDVRGRVRERADRRADELSERARAGGAT